MGTTDSSRQVYYRHAKAGYKLRNAIVHGGENLEKALYNALVDFYPELQGKTVNDALQYMTKATEELQRIVRLVLRAYLHMRDNGTRQKWPEADELECLALDSTRRCLIQKQLGITVNQLACPHKGYHFLC